MDDRNTQLAIQMAIRDVAEIPYTLVMTPDGQFVLEGPDLPPDGIVLGRRNGKIVTQKALRHYFILFHTPSQ